jgi:hypothetical protein
MTQHTSPKPKTPQAEAAEWLLIGGAAVGVLAYFGAIHNVPVISGVAYGIASMAYASLPQLSGIRMAHAPELVASTILGLLACVLIGVAMIIVGTPDRMERQADKLKRRRDRRRMRLNGRSDKFIVR